MTDCFCKKLVFFVYRNAKINHLSHFQLEFVACENVEHGITSELFYCLKIQLDL